MAQICIGSNNDSFISSRTNASQSVLQYDALEQLLVCEDGEVDLGWGNCNSINAGSTPPNGCMPSGCFSIEETNELSFSYVNLGEFPSNIGELTNLININISDCGLTGSLPVSLGNLNNLTSIGVYDNDHGLLDSLGINSELSGPIPLELCNLESLRYIRFDNNNLSGEIPFEVGHLENLIYLILSGNQLSGEIPSNLMVSSTLNSLALSNNQFSGQIPLEIVDLVNLEIIDFSNNLLSGFIPPGMESLSELYFVNLSNNKLSGSINEQFCDMYLTDFSGNRFCKPYPQCFSIEEVALQDTSSCSDLFSLNKNDYPNTFKINQNYPNPFNPITSLKYDLAEDGLVNITIFDITGRRVKTLVNGLQTAGYKSIEWNGTNDKNEPVSGGLYMVMIQAGKFIQTKKMVLLK